MNVFITGSTGFLGGEILVNIAKRKDVDTIYCLVRAADEKDAHVRLQKVFDLHGDIYDKKKIIPIRGDLSKAGLAGILSADDRLKNIQTIIHAAANTSFTKIFDSLVEQVNIKGLTEILTWSKTLKSLDSFVYIGTATICGKQISNRLVTEEESPNPDAQHLVKYTYTKMVGELLLHEYLPEDKILIVRPSIVMGDSRPWVPRSTVIMWALATLNELRLIPINPNSQLDIVPVDYVANAIEKLIFSKRKYQVYHISSGKTAATNLSKLTKAIESYFPKKPAYNFVPYDFYNQMLLWSKDKLADNKELYSYPEYLNYWKQLFPENDRMRMLLYALKPYIDFVELGQVFDNTRLLTDIGMEQSAPADEYILNSALYMQEIDVFEGAVDA